MTLIIVLLMFSSLAVIAGSEVGNALEGFEDRERILFTTKVLVQIRWQLIGWVVFFLAASFDYHKLREWTWILYMLCLFALIGVFFVEPIANVHRWYRIPFLGMSIQPAEYTKVVLVMAMSWYLEQHKSDSYRLKVAFGLFTIVLPIFLLILKQPDLGSALVLLPLVAVMMTFGDMHQRLQRVLWSIGLAALAFVLTIFLGIIDHEQMRPLASSLVQDYQYERLNPNSYHQMASQTAIAIGGLYGKGMYGGSFSQGGWLPEATTDSVFAAWGEMFGFVGMVGILILYLILLNQALQSAVVAKDSFGQLLAAGICVYFGIHVLINVGMMSGLLPITGVPLPLMTYGGSSVLSNMVALGILQSIYSRRFIF